MGNEVAAGIHVVAATKDGVIEYWAAAVPQTQAVAAVQAQLAPDWRLFLTNRRLPIAKVAALKLRPGTIRRLKSKP